MTDRVNGKFGFDQENLVSIEKILFQLGKFCFYWENPGEKWIVRFGSKVAIYMAELVNGFNQDNLGE